MVTQKVILTKDLKYVKDNRNIVIKKGTEVLVDLSKNIALIGIDHVDIFPNEYIVKFMH